MAYHNGWTVIQVPSNPITGRWVAYRHGVRMCAATKAGITAMIDIWNKERAAAESQLCAAL